MTSSETALSAVWKTSFQASSDGWGPDAQALELHRSLLQSIEARDPQGAEAAIIGEVIADANGFVQMETAFGGRRMVDWLTGEQLPRIC